MSNTDAFRRTITYFTSGDAEGLKTVLDENIYSLGLGAVDATHGIEALVAGFPEGGEFEVEVADVHSEGDRVSALLHVKATYGDQSISYDIAEWGTYRDGKMTERRVYSNDTARIMEWFSRLG